MKISFRFLKNTALAIILLCVCQYSQAQFLKRLKDKVTQTAADHVTNDAGNATDKTIDKTEDAAKNGSQNGSNNSSPDNSSTSSADNSGNSVASNNSPAAPSLNVYQNYDFIAGDKILFSDDFTADQDGEFPAHWELVKGQGVVNQQQGFPSFTLTDGNYFEMNPRISTKNYLPNEFTLEFDTYFESGSYGPIIIFHLSDGQNNEDGLLHVTNNDASYYSDQGALNLSANYPESMGSDNYENKWHHVAIGIKNKQIKIYVDQARVLVIPDCKMAFGSLTLAGVASTEAPIIIKNVKIAEGGSQNTIGNMLTNGKFITHGITFDIDKSIIKPESMGVLNQVAKFLKDNSSIKMEIDGHTDNSGQSAHNLTLSQQRADAVKIQLVSMGVDAGRLTTKGFGDSKPISDNSSPEGKANNRRVEFVKM